MSTTTSRPAKPRRAVRARTDVERRFLALGEAAEAFLRAAAAAGTTRLPAHLAVITTLEAAHGRDQLIAALSRAIEFRRFTGEDVRRILAAGVNAPKPVAAGQKLAAVLPLVPTRALDAYRSAQGGGLMPPRAAAAPLARRYPHTWSKAYAGSRWAPSAAKAPKCLPPQRFNAGPRKKSCAP